MNKYKLSALVSDVKERVKVYEEDCKKDIFFQHKKNKKNVKYKETV